MQVFLSFVVYYGIIYLIAGNFVETVIASFIMTFVIFEGKVAMTYAEKLLQDSKNRFVELRENRRNLEDKLKELEEKNEELEKEIRILRG